MAVNVKSYPVATEPNTGELSYWSACYNYVRFIFQRQDRVLQYITDDSGYAVLKLSTVPPTGTTVGTKVFFSKADETIQAEATITNIYGTELTIDYPYSSSFSGFVNFPTVIKDWRVEVIFDEWNGTDYQPINGQLLTSTDPIAKFQALPNARAIADVQEFLKPLLENVYTYNDSELNQLDSYSSAQYRVRYRENYYGLSAGAYSVLKDGDGNDIDFFVTNSALQLKDSLAPNMANYLMIDDADSEGLFLSGFEEPTYFIGYPFDISFIYKEGNGVLNLLQQWFDINKTQVDYSAQGATEDFNGHISRLGVDRGAQTSSPYAYTKLVLQASAFPYPQICEQKYIRAKEVCNNPVMLTWRNQLGGWDYWVFTQRNITNLTVSNGDVYNPYVDMSSDSKEVLLSKEASESIQLAASNLDSNDVNGLKGLLKSIAVFVLDNTGTVQYRTNIMPGTWKVSDTKQPLIELSFTIIKPSQYIQTQ